MEDIIGRGPGPRVAVIGGGIVGMVLTLALIHRNVSVRLYEQADGFREVGAGIAFSASARHCMKRMDPAIVEALRRCGAVSVSDEDDNEDYLRWLDGYNHPNDGEVAGAERPLAEIGGSGFRGCRRDQFIEELFKEAPQGCIEFGKRLDKFRQQDNGTVILSFVDGIEVEVDAVIGCDGIKSRVRRQLFGTENPASYPQYTHKVAYRGLVPMDKAVEVLGKWKAYNFHHHVGPGAHLTHYPVANHTTLNVVVFLSDPNSWPENTPMATEGSREDVIAAMANWHPTVLGLVKLLPKTLNKWALFDTGEFPAPAYNDGNVCIAGDAAHASSPHHGAGACAGIEDALCLSALLGDVQDASQAVRGQTETQSFAKSAIRDAFETFDVIRRPRTQWLVNSSRRVCDLYHQEEWADPRRWIKAQTCFEEIRDRSYKIWYFDGDDMVEQAIKDFHSRMIQQTNGEKVCKVT